MYLFNVIKTRASCRNGWTKILGKVDTVFKPGSRDVKEGDKIRVWKRADCSCPSFRRNQKYLFLGNDGPRLLVDYNSIVLKWEAKKFKRYISHMKDLGGCG